MSYVKISDPAIIDLSGIQQIINVVNQHSDYLNVLINRFGLAQTIDWGNAKIGGLYDSATTNIAFGKETITSDDFEETNGGKTYYAKYFSFENNITFTDNPLIVLSLDNSDGAEGNQLDFILSVHNVSTSGFTIRAVRSGFYNGKETIENNIKINWIAIGPR